MAGWRTSQQQQPPASPAAPIQDQLVPVLLALVLSLVGRLPADDPARLAATAALARVNPSPPPSMASRPCRSGLRPRILQWNCNHLGPRNAELADHLLREQYDVAAL
ncbi:uncharacterized protein LOC144168827 [Haemaphysalis longicornis]